MSYFCTFQATLSLFPDTTSVNSDLYIIASTGTGQTPSDSYKNAVAMASTLYDANLVQYITSKNYPNLQIESSLKSIITYLEERTTIPLSDVPLNVFNWANSIKNTVVVRNLNSSSNQNTSTSTSTTTCLFEAYYKAVDASELDENKDMASIYLISCITTNNNSV